MMNKSFNSKSNLRTAQFRIFTALIAMAIWQIVAGPICATNNETKGATTFYGAKLQNEKPLPGIIKETKLYGEIDMLGAACADTGMKLSKQSIPATVKRIDPDSAAYRANVRKDDRVLSAEIKHNDFCLSLQRGEQKLYAEIPLSKEFADEVSNTALMHAQQNNFQVTALQTNKPNTQSLKAEISKKASLEPVLHLLTGSIDRSELIGKLRLIGIQCQLPILAKEYPLVASVAIDSPAYYKGITTKDQLVGFETLDKGFKLTIERNGKFYGAPITPTGDWLHNMFKTNGMWFHLKSITNIDCFEMANILKACGIVCEFPFGDSLVVYYVIPGSSAYATGIKAGDKIVRFNTIDSGFEATIEQNDKYYQVVLRPGQ